MWFIPALSDGWFGGFKDVSLDVSTRVGVVVAAIGKLQLQQLTIGLTTWYRQRSSRVPYLPNLQYLQCLGRQASLGRQVSLGSQGMLQHLQYLLQRCKFGLQVPNRNMDRHGGRSGV